MPQGPRESDLRPNNDNYLIAELLKVNAQLTEQLIEMAKTLAQFNEPTPLVPMESFHTNMNTPETEEDAQFAFSRGLINKEQLEDTLKEIGFYNAEITVPS